jgi:hypothetical protein
VPQRERLILNDLNRFNYLNGCNAWLVS